MAERHQRPPMERWGSVLCISQNSGAAPAPVSTPLDPFLTINTQVLNIYASLENNIINASDVIK